MVGELDDICSSIHGLLSSQKRGLKYNDIVDQLKDKGSRATINKHLRDLEQNDASSTTPGDAMFRLTEELSRAP